MKTILLVPLLLCTILVAHAQSMLLPNEESVLYFTTGNGKEVLLAKDTLNKYLVYRFGKAGKPEFEYPETDKSSIKKFTYSYYLRGGGIANEGMDLNYIYFINGDFKYTIYDTYYAVGNERNIGVKVLNLKTQNKTDIKGNNKSRKGTLTGFRDNLLVNIGEETDGE